MAILNHGSTIRTADGGQSTTTIVTASNIGSYAVASSATYYIGTTQNVFNRASGAQTLTGVSIDGNAANITAYTINQNVGTSNTPSFAGIVSSAITNYAYLQVTDVNNFWITPGNANWGLYFETSAGGLLGGSGDSNRLGFVGAGAARFYVDLNNGNGWFGGSLTANTDSRAPIFYDSNDTAYYVDPNSVSRLASLRIYSAFDTASSDVYANMRVMRNNATTDGMYIGYGNSGSTSALTRIFGGGATTGELSKYSTYTLEPGSFRSPIFYDSDNTGYYLDAASTSNLNILGVAGRAGIGGAGSRSTNGLTVGFTDNSTFAANTDVGDTDRMLSIVNESSTTNAMAVLGFRVNPNGGTANAMLDIKYVQTGATNTSGLHYTFNHGGSFLDRFSILSSGNVGIGAIAPDTNLQVVGHVHVGNQTTFENTGGWNKTIYLDGTYHARVRVIGSAYASGKNSQTETYLWVDNTVSPYSGLATNAGSFQISAGFTTMLNSARSPLFYDSDNTAYYCDPASTSVLAVLQATRINFGATGSTPYTSAAGEGFGNGITFGGDDNSAYYRIFTGMENVGGNYSKLTLNWHTGIRIGAYINYGGVRFYNNSVGQGGTEIFSVGNLDSNVRVVNNLIVNGITINQERANNARMYGAGTGAFGLLGLDSAGSFRWQVYGESGNYGFLDSTWGAWDIKKVPNGELDLRVSSANVRVLNAGNYSGYSTFTASLTSTVDARAPIFYDSNNTGYYCDPASNSVLNGLYVNAYYNLSNDYKDIYVYGDVNTYYVVLIEGNYQYSFGRYSVTRGYNWTGPDTWYTASHKGGLTLDWEWSGDTAWGGNDKAIRIIEFNESYSTMVAGLGYPVNGGVIIWLRGGGVGGAQYRIRTPIGSNATVTAYDGVSATNHSTLTTFTAADSSVFTTRANTNNVSAEILARYPVRSAASLYNDNNLVVDIGSGTQTKSGIFASAASVRAPIFYDTDNTAYYIDAVNTSNLLGLTVVNTITGNITGNAGTATILQTARNINGTSFNGSAAITTASWGTARTLTIGSTGKSVDGSAAVAWSLAEIGAAAIAQTMFIGTTSVAINRASAGQTLTGISIDGSAASCTGNAATVTNGVYITGDQTISGIKYFTSTVDPSTVPAGYAGGYILESTTGFGTYGIIFGSATGQHGAIGYSSNTMYFGTENGTDNTLNTKATLSSGGTFTANGDVRSPIFYDSANTAYYIDAASTSNLLGLTVTNTITGSITGNAGGTSSNITAYTINQSVGTGNSPTFVTVTGTAINIAGSGASVDPYGTIAVTEPANASNYSYYGLTRAGVVGAGFGLTGTTGALGLGANAFWFGTATSSAAGVMSAAYVAFNNSSLATIGTVDATQFRDRDNTAYYVDPASTSVLNTIRLAGKLTNNGSVSDDDGFGVYWDGGESTAYAIYREAGSWTGPYPDLRIAFHTGIKLGANAGYNGIRFYNDYDMATQVMSVNNSGDGLGANNVYVNNALQAGGSLRAPIFYDTDNTGYYVDPNSTSNLVGLTVVNTITGNITGNAGTATILQTARNINGTSFNGSAAITTATWGTARTITIGSTGKSVDGSAAVAWSLAEIGAAATNQTMFIGTTSVAINRASASQTLTGISIDGSSASCTGNSATTTLATKATRANGNFYIDDNYGNTVVGAYNAARYQGVYAMGDSYKLAADGTTTGTLYGIAWSHPNAGGAAGNLSDHGALILINGGYVAAISSSIRCTVDMRTPIYYDSNNTAYYTDPASTSNLNAITAAGNITAAQYYTGGWFRNSSSGNGLYNESSTQHFYSDDVSYWNVASSSSAQGIRLRTGGHAGTVRGYFYADTNNDVGLLNNAGNWRVRVVGGDYLLADGSSIRGQIFYDTNNTAYYIDAASTSNLVGLTVANTITGSVSGNSGNVTISNLNTQQVSTGTLTSGAWYTIAVNAGDRASAKFTVTNGDSGLHQAVQFYATAEYGTDVGAKISVVSNTYYSGPPIGNIRIMRGSTYDGAMVQVYINNNCSITISIYDNQQSGGWVIKNGILSTINPGGVSSFASLTTNAAQVDLNSGKSFSVSDQLYIGGATTQYIALHANNYVGYSAFTGNVDGTQFRDANDTSFYLDPAGTSNLNKFSAFTMSYNDMNSMHIQSPYVTRYNSGANYRNGTMGWGTVDCNHMFSNWGSGFIDSWTNPANAPGSSSHYVGFQGLHYNHQNNSQAYGFQMLCAGEADNRFFWRSAWPNLRSWVEMIHTGNIGSQTVATAGSCTGNAATATILQTARNINGTSFNGSAAITTATWGTARTITIGSTGKSVDGSANVSWTLAELGAAATNQTMFIGTTSIAINRASASQTLTGTSIDGSSASCTGNAATATTTDNINGRAFYNRNSGNALGQDAYTNNGIGYVNSVSLYGQTDGGIYTSAYDTSWIHQIYGDFRTGQIAIRGRNNGTWQSWRFVLDSSNVSSYALPISGGTITGAISTNVSGTSIFIGNQNVSTTNALRINWHADADLNYFIGKRGGAWTQPMDIAFYTGIKYHANSTYNAHIFYVGGFDTTEAFSIGKGDNHVRVNNYLYAPLMYDTNDTAFYCNPGGNSIFNTIKTNNVYGGNASVTAASSTTINTAYNLTELTMAAFITTLTFSNIQSTGTVHMWTIVTLGNGSATSVTWPAAIKWPGGTAPNITGTNTKRDIYQFITYDGGTNIYAIIVGQNL